MKGNAGLSVGLKDLTINTTGNVTVGGGRSAAGTTYTGQIRTDEGVSIHGADVTVGDRITSINNGVDIQASGNINVDGIKARERINLTTTGENGAIVLNNTYNDGALNTESTENDAVIIDARGANGSFQNLTSAEKAIKTGEGGNWKVYSASPDRDDFGTNLDSKTTARWHASSQGGNGLDAYAETEDTNKYIFQVQPTVTVKADDQTKVYGDTADVTKYTTTATASFTGRNGEYSVSDARFTPAFQEGTLKDRYTGEIELSSEGAAEEKTRMDGDIDRTSSDNARPYFVINAEGENLAGKEGYAVTTADGTLEILRRDANISGTGTQTYGNPDISLTTDKDHSNLVNGDDVDADKVSIRAGSDYTDSQKDRKTANAGTYNNSAAFGGILNKNGEDASINYNLIGTGTIKVKKAGLTVTVGNAETVYGTPFDESKYDYAYSTETGKSLVNGDTKESLLKDLGTIGYDNEAALDGTDGKWTAAVGDDYTLAFTDATEGAFNALNNYNVSFVNGKASVTPAPLKVTRNGYTTEYGTVLLEDAAHRFTTWDTLVNGDVDDIKVDNKDYGGAYLDGNTRTNDASDTPYTFKEALTSDSNVLRNYTLDDTGMNSVTITPHTITSDDIVNGNPTFETVYGTTDKKLDVVINGVNGDGNIANTSTTTAYIYDEATGKASKTANVGNDYSITTVLNNTNYRFDNGTNTKLFERSAKVTPATLKVTRNGYTTEYGTVLLEDAAHRFTTWGTLANGDVDDIKVDNKDYGGAYLDGNTRTNNASDTPYTFKEALTSDSNVLRNYTLDDTGMNSVTITPHTITSDDIVNGNPTFETVYGNTDKKLDVVINGVNGDGNIANTSTTTAYIYDKEGNPIKTANVGNDYSITSVLNNKNYRFDNGSATKTFEKSAKVTEAELKIKTENVETKYGTVKTTTSTVDGLVNGDLPTGFIYDYGDYGGAYLDDKTKTNDVNTYHFDTKIKTMGKDGLVTPDFLNNYTITGGEADVKIDPKDVTFFVSGTGNTLADVTYTVDPDIDAQLAYGEHVDADYTPGNDLGSNQYGVVAHINGTPIVTGDVAGNYRYNYGGLITLSPTVPTKPDIDPHNPSNLDGSGSWTSNMGNHGVPGVERVAGLASAELPFFKVEAGQVSHYGTYDVAADPDKVRLEPTGKRLPEPNQPKTQYREYTKTLTTTDGTGMFRMVYDGSVFRITPTDDAALALVRTGDVKNNVELSAEALHAGFSEMGILLEDLDGVYVHFENLH
ncbi:hypothetical protein ACTNCI_11975 [Mitsuokella jalaludinii]|uniref:hypothetical protein n=1 Tax=Mitsuokella jalaludinii TaxID=187979 RepID=UPI003F89D34C